MTRTISVSLAPYDGYPTQQALAHLAACGVDAVEPAFIVGYTEPFDQSAFTNQEGQRWLALLKQTGLHCHALSAHIDLGLPDAVEVFIPRMDFARAIGAHIICTNACRRDRETQFLRNMERLARHADDIGLRIALENPGNGEDNVLNLGSDAETVLRQIGSQAVGLNFDSANLASHRPEADILSNTREALPLCLHYHAKDVARLTDGWHFRALGQGDIDQTAIVMDLARRPELPVSIELPLRLHRGVDAQPVRAAEPLPLVVIETAIKDSLTFLRVRLSEF